MINDRFITKRLFTENNEKKEEEKNRYLDFGSEDENEGVSQICGCHQKLEEV